MVLMEYNGKKPTISENCYVSPMATLIGDVTVNDNVVIWPGSIIRAEFSQINIGEYSTIFDGVILLTRLHKGSLVFEESSIGEGAVILNKSQVPPGLIIPARAVMKGIPVERVREQSRNDVLEQKERAHHYTQLFLKIKNMLPNAQSYLLTLPDFIKLLIKKEI